MGTAGLNLITFLILLQEPEIIIVNNKKHFLIENGCKWEEATDSKSKMITKKTSAVMPAKIQYAENIHMKYQ